MKKILVMETGSYITFGGAAKASYQLYSGLKANKKYSVEALGEYSKLGKSVEAVKVEEMLGKEYAIIFMNSVRDIIYVDQYVKLHPKAKIVYVDRSNTLLNYRSQGLSGLPPDIVVSFLSLKPVEKLFSEEVLKLSFRKWKTHMTEEKSASTKFLSSVAIAGGDVVKRYLMRRMKRWLAMYVAITPEQESYAKQFFRGKVKVQYIPIAPDIEYKKLGKRGPFDGALYVGRLDERQKRLSFLINALAELKKRHPEVAHRPLLRLVGNGTNGENYKDLVKSLGLGEEVSFIGNTVGKKLVEIYNDAAFFVSPSAWESPGRTFLEAMACGLPLLINTENNTLVKYAKKQRMVEDGWNGLVYAYWDTEDFINKFYELYTNKRLRSKLAANALSFSKQFSLPKIIEQYRKLADSL